MVQVPQFPMVSFEIINLNDINSSFSHLLGDLSLPTCSLCMSNYATVKTTYNTETYATYNFVLGSLFSALVVRRTLVVRGWPRDHLESGC